MRLMSYAKNYHKMDKTDILIEAMYDPERFATSEIEELLNDREVKETFDLLDKTMSSLHPITVPDIEEEWKRFERNHQKRCENPRVRLKYFLSRNIAASIAVAVASLTAVAAIMGVSIARMNNSQTPISSREVTGEAVGAEAHPDSIIPRGEYNAIPAEVMVFDNETLEKILSEVSTYYGINVIFYDEAVKSLRLYFRWDPAMTAEEVVERLNNFEQINIVVDGRTIKVD